MRWGVGFVVFEVGGASDALVRAARPLRLLVRILPLLHGPLLRLALLLLLLLENCELLGWLYHRLQRLLLNQGLNHAIGSSRRRGVDCVVLLLGDGLECGSLVRCQSANSLLRLLLLLGGGLLCALLHQASRRRRGCGCDGGLFVVVGGGGGGVELVFGCVACGLLLAQGLPTLEHFQAGHE